MPKRYLTGGGKRLKNQTKSNSYLDNILKKITNLKKILTFARYDRIGEEDSRSDYSRHCIQFILKKSKPYAARWDTWTQLVQKIFRKNGMPIHKEVSRTTFFNPITRVARIIHSTLAVIGVLLSKEKVNSLLTINYRASRDPTRRQGSMKKLKNY